MTEEKHTDDQYYEDEQIRRHRKLGMHHEDRIPMINWRNYALAFLIGVGVAAAGCPYAEQWKKKEPSQEQPAKPKKEYMKVDDFGRELFASPKGRRLLNQLKDEIYARTIGKEVGGSAQQEIASAICDLAVDDESVIDDKRLERELEVVFDDRTPVGKLWMSYKGPVPVPETTLEDKLKLRQVYEQWKRYRPIMMRLLDTDGNDGHSDEELNRAAYKILKQ